MKNSLSMLNLEDDFLFAKVMSDNECCRKILETILHTSIKKVTTPVTQKTIDLLLESKGIRLDVYANDENGTTYNAEMERGKKKGLPKRSRYYQGCMDLDLISAGKPYTTLKRTFVIFICTFDPFGRKSPVYTFQNFCREFNGLPLNDETTKIFLNTKGNLMSVDLELGEFLRYVEHTTDEFAASCKGKLVKEIHKKVTAIKQSKEMEMEYMTLYQRDLENIEIGRAQGRRAGKREGKREGKLEGSLNKTLIVIRNMLNRGMTDEDICALAECDAALIDKVRKENPNSF